MTTRPTRTIGSTVATCPLCGWEFEYPIVSGLAPADAAQIVATVDPVDLVVELVHASLVAHAERIEIVLLGHAAAFHRAYTGEEFAKMVAENATLRSDAHGQQ
ncbi:MAG TPA: hypothetical protein VGN51_19715 [Acidimicrobiia bacterium]|jgi:hypothetical protein